MEKPEIVIIAEKLAKAKEAVSYCLEHSTGLVDMHGLSYWAQEVENLRGQIKKNM